MTPVAARRRQDVGRTGCRGCWACRRGCWVGRRGRVGFACGFALSGDGRHKWRPYVWCGGDGVVGRRWWMLGGPSRSCWVRLWFRPAGLSWCRCVVGAPFMTPVAARRRQDVGRTDSREVLGVSSRACWVRLWFRPAGLSWCRCVVGAPFMTPVAARRRQDVGRTDSREVLGVSSRGVGSACGFALPGDGRHKWRPYVWCGGDEVVGRRWWMLGEPSRGVLLESLSFLPRRPFLLPRRPSDRMLRRYGQVGCRRRGGWRGMDGAVRYTFYYI